MKLNKYRTDGSLYSASELKARRAALQGHYIVVGYKGTETLTPMGRLDTDTMQYVRREPYNVGRNAVKRMRRLWGK